MAVTKAEEEAKRGHDRLTGEVSHIRKANEDMSGRMPDNVHRSIKNGQQRELEMERQYWQGMRQRSTGFDRGLGSM